MKKFIFFLLFTVHLTFNIEHCFSQSGWINQPLPINANSYDMKFFDANTGVISLENYYVFRTTNSGQNWYISQRIRIFQMEKVNDTVLYGTGRKYNGYEVVYRTFNRGVSWDSVFVSLDNVYGGLSFINKDTGWICGFNGSSPIIWITYNGGMNFISQSSNTGQDKIFFLKYKINNGYYGWSSFGNSMYKTTNSGVNWFLVGPAGTLTQLNMIDTSIGWASNGSVNILKTTNGGLNWLNLPMPTGNGIVIRNIDRFKILNYNKIYGVGGTRYFGNGIYKGIVWITTNGGLTWGFQQPDTAITYGYYGVIDFVDSLKGWCEGIHTTNGGGIITKISNYKEQIAKEYILSQNYPNPFNPVTKINYELPKDGKVKLVIYDILGREMKSLVNNEFKQAGRYTVEFDGSQFASGVYFYRIQVEGGKGYTAVKKMVFIK